MFSKLINLLFSKTRIETIRLLMQGGVKLTDKQYLSVSDINVRLNHAGHQHLDVHHLLSLKGKDCAWLRNLAMFNYDAPDQVAEMYGRLGSIPEVKRVENTLKYPIIPKLIAKGKSLPTNVPTSRIISNLERFLSKEDTEIIQRIPPELLRFKVVGDSRYLIVDLKSLLRLYFTEHETLVLAKTLYVYLMDKVLDKTPYEELLIEADRIVHEIINAPYTTNHFYRLCYVFDVRLERQIRAYKHILVMQRLKDYSMCTPLKYLFFTLLETDQPECYDANVINDFYEAEYGATRYYYEGDNNG